MLNSLREGSSARTIKILALGFVMLGVGGMVFMDVGGFFRGGVTDTTLARVGRDKISIQQFERMAQPSVRSQNMSMQEAYRFGLLQNLLDETIAREALRAEARREGLVVGRDDIAARVHDLIKAQVQPGETPQKVLDRILQTQGLTQNDLVASMSQSITASLVEAPLKDAVSYVPQLMSRAMDRFHAERRDIVFFTLSAEKVGAGIKADDEQLKAYYETVKDQYQIPEARTFRAITISPEDVKGSVSITTADVKAAYEERKDQFRIEERRTFEQVIVQDETKAKEISESARKKASLRSLAGQADYREPTEASLSALPKELAVPVFETAKGTVLNPIKTPLGWHVIRVTGITPARMQSFADVQADLRRELESDALHTEMESRIGKIDEALGQGDTFDDIAKNLSLSVVTVGPLDAQGNAESAATGTISALQTAVAANKDLLASMFELMEGETGDLAEVGDGAYALFTLETVRPTRDRDFAEIRPQLEKKWLEEKQLEALNAKVEALMADLTRNGKSFDDAAKEAGAVIKTARDVGRTSKVAGLNDPVALTRLFDETDLSEVVKVPLGRDVILAKVLDARIPETDGKTASAETEAQWRSRMEQAVTTLYVSDLRARDKVKVNDKLLERMYGAETDVQP